LACWTEGIRAGAPLAALLWLLAAPLAAETRQDTATVILLGTGTPFPDPKANGPATAVTVGTRLFLFDAGAGIERQMNAAGLPVRGGPVTAVFLTHLHSDHTLGLPDLILSSWVMGRKAPLRIIGPSGTRAMTDHILQAWSEDIAVRTNGLEHETPGGERVDVREVRGGVVYDSAGVQVTAIPVAHGSWKYAFAYRIEANGKRILISGDTRPSPALEAAARDLDILIHEAYSAGHLAPEDRPGGDSWPAYMRSFHTSDVEVGALARRVQPRLLVLYHIVRMGADDAELLAGVREGGFLGPTVVGRDLDRF
jgi:ribonuclease Z